MKAVILYISFISFTFGISIKDVGTLIKSITLYGNINTSNIVTDIYIGAVTESIYSYSYGIETQLSSLGLKGRYNKIFLNLGFSQGGFFQRNIHESSHPQHCSYSNYPLRRHFLAGRPGGLHGPRG